MKAIQLCLPIDNCHEIPLTELNKPKKQNSQPKMWNGHPARHRLEACTTGLIVQINFIYLLSSAKLDQIS